MKQEIYVDVRHQDFWWGIYAFTPPTSWEDLIFTAYRRELQEKRLQGYREEIRRIASYLQAEQVALTQRHIARYLVQPAILRDPKVRALLREVCREVEEHT
jgi:hypothetical protein